MPTRARPRVVPFRFVQHDGPDDWLHYETLSVHAGPHAWTIGDHQHDDLHQFLLLESGLCAATIDGRSHTLQGPVATMMPPGAVHGFVYQPGCRGRNVTVPSAQLREALRHDAGLAVALSQVVMIEGGHAHAAGCFALFETIAREFDGGLPGRREYLQTLSLQLCLWFLRSADACAGLVRRDGARDTLVQRYLSLIEGGLGDRLPIGHYAGQLGVTANHLSRVCRMSKGMSALELLHERQYLEARRLLAYTDMSVGEVAEALGFDDSNYFSRFFTRRCGQSPLAYRQQPTAAAHPVRPGR